MESILASKDYNFSKGYPYWKKLREGGGEGGGRTNDTIKEFVGKLWKRWQSYKYPTQPFEKWFSTS